MSPKTVVSLAEFQRLCADREGFLELDEGELIQMSPHNQLHSIIAGNFYSELREHVKKHRLGRVYGPDIGCVLHRNPDIVREPDVSFVAGTRTGGDLEQFFEGAPDLVVEVTSPSDRLTQVRRKLRQDLEHGTSEVLLVHPDSEEIEVYAGAGLVRTLNSDQVLESPLLPGFSVPVRTFFEA